MTTTTTTLDRRGWQLLVMKHTGPQSTNGRSLHTGPCLWLVIANRWQDGHMWRLLCRGELSRWRLRWRSSTATSTKVLLLKLGGQAWRPISQQIGMRGIRYAQSMLIRWLPR